MIPTWPNLIKVRPACQFEIKSGTGRGRSPVTRAGEKYKITDLRDPTMRAPSLDAAEPPALRSVRPVFLMTLAGTLVWMAAIVLAPILRSRSSGAAPFFYAAFSPICHQLPGRSFFLRGFPLAVCGRCFGIYSGFLAGAVLYPLIRGFKRLALPSIRLFFLASLPAAIEVLLGLTKLWQAPIGMRFATGFVWGALLPFYFITGVTELVLWARFGRTLIIPGQKP